MSASKLGKAIGRRQRAQPAIYEAEVVPGIEDLAIQELREKCGRRLHDITTLRPGFIRFALAPVPAALLSLRSIIALYRVYIFAIPRPKALLGHQHFSRLLKILQAEAASFQRKPQTFGIGAAGANTSVMRRLRQELAQALALVPAADGKGELFMRLLRQADGAGWEVLLRAGAAPLSKRAYRLRDMPGALNSTVAYAMTRCAAPPETGTVVNLCSGSATILIEHGCANATGALLAVERDPAMLAAGDINVEAAGLSARIWPLQADATAVPLPAGAAHRLYADLPFGNLIGTHESNRQLYPRLLKEAARIAQPDAPFIVLTQEIKLLRACLAESPWHVISERRLNLRGMRPRLFVLKRNSIRIE